MNGLLEAMEAYAALKVENAELHTQLVIADTDKKILKSKIESMWSNEEVIEMFTLTYAKDKVYGNLTSEHEERLIKLMTEKEIS